MREVDRGTYDAVIRSLRATQDLDPAVNKPGGIGRVEQWRTPEGRICAWVQVDYWHGEHDVHYLVDTRPAPPP